MTTLLIGLECETNAFCSSGFVDSNHLGSCSHNLSAWREFKITVQRQTLEKTETKAMMTWLSGLKSATSAFCRFIFVDKSLGLMFTQFLCMEKIQVYCSKADSGKDKSKGNDDLAKRLGVRN